MKRFLRSFLLLSGVASAQVPVIQGLSNLVTRPMPTGARMPVQPLVDVIENGVVLRFTADPTNALATNRFMVGTNSVGRWVHKWGGDIQAFGVKADGTTDDTDAFNAAADYVLNSDNDVETLILPAGTIVHSGFYLTPTKNKLLRIRGSSANSATAVAPFGTRILLKAGSTNVLFSIQLSSSHRLRLDVRGVYMDGNRDNCPDASDVLRIAGNGSSYLSAGTWEDCAFNRGNRHGILLTNAVYQFKATRVNCQSNRHTGLWTDRGGDHHFTGFLSEKSGDNGVYHYITENTTWQDSDIAFNGGNGMFLDDCRKLRVVNCDISVAGKSSIVLNGGSNNNMMHSGFVNCRIGSPNSSLAGVPTNYPSGTYSTVLLTGGSGTHWGHVFENCMILAFEANDTTRPKYVFEDARTNITWTTFPGGGMTIVGCSASSATNYTTSGRFSPGFENNANLIALNDHGGSFGMTNSLASLIVKGQLLGQGISTFGSATNGIPPLKAIGGVSASSILTIDRPGNGTAGFAMSGDTLRIMDEANGTQMVAFVDDGSTATMVLGGNGTPRTTRIYGVIPTGTDAAGLPLRLIVGGTGRGTNLNANVEVWIPQLTTNTISGTSVQTVYRAFAITGRPTGKRTTMLLWDNEAEVLNQVTSTNLTIYHTNGTVLHSGKFLIFE